jgi:hypothetical protein
METFMTSREVEAEKLDRQKREKEQADSRARDEQIARDNAARWRAGEKDWLREQALREEEKLCVEGNDRVTVLATLRARAADLKSQIENENELVTIHQQIDSTKHQILSRPLSEASPSTIDALTRWRALAELWPTRKALLQEQLGLVEQQITDSESALDKLKNGLATVKLKLSGLVKT